MALVVLFFWLDGTSRSAALCYLAIRSGTEIHSERRCPCWNTPQRVALGQRALERRFPEGLLSHLPSGTSPRDQPVDCEFIDPRNLHKRLKTQPIDWRQGIEGNRTPAYASCDPWPEQPEPNAQRFQSSVESVILKSSLQIVTQGAGASANGSWLLSRPKGLGDPSGWASGCPRGHHFESAATICGWILSPFPHIGWNPSVLEIGVTSCLA